MFTRLKSSYLELLKISYVYLDRIRIRTYLCPRFNAKRKIIMMRSFCFATLLSLFVLAVSAQNTSQRIIANNEGLHIGGYGQIDMNLQSEDNIHHNAKLDIHRLVTFLGYNFNDKVSFISS